MQEEHVRHGANSESKLKVYSGICTALSPVMHFFFQENYPDPSTWLEKVRCYSVSVAASSILGFVSGLGKKHLLIVLNLGDRHAQNILIDKESAEVVHIDLGIAFDQGKLLPTPEKVIRKRTDS
jgi:ataxia telangiectasia mutated family protein